MAQLDGEARQHCAARGRVLIAPGEIVEMRDPGEEPRRQHVGAPSDGVPGDILGEPALYQLACCLPGFRPSQKQTRNPAEAVPLGEPFHSGRGWKPARGGAADQLAGELDFSGGDCDAALWIARPCQAGLELEIGGNPSYQSVAIKSRNREPL